MGRLLILKKIIIAENFPNLWKGMDIQVHQANRKPYYLNAKRPFLRHCQSVFKLSKIGDKERILKVTRRKRIPIKALAKFSAETR